MFEGTSVYRKHYGTHQLILRCYWEPREGNNPILPVRDVFARFFQQAHSNPVWLSNDNLYTLLYHMGNVFWLVEPSKSIFYVDNTTRQEEDRILRYIGCHSIPNQNKTLLTSNGGILVTQTSSQSKDRILGFRV